MTIECSQSVLSMVVKGAPVWERKAGIKTGYYRKELLAQ